MQSKHGGGEFLKKISVWQHRSSNCKHGVEGADWNVTLVRLPIILNMSYSSH